MEIQVSVAKVVRFQSSEGGEQVETMERPNGGLTVVLAEGKLNGQPSETIAKKAVQRLLALIQEGIHDGAATRAVLSKIKTEHHDTAGVKFSILSVDLVTGTIILTKNDSVPVVLIRNGEGELISDYAEQVGYDPEKPSVYQFDIEKNFTIILFSDGIANSGKDFGHTVRLSTLVESLFEESTPSVYEIADFVLNQAISRDFGKPHDDMTVIAFQVNPLKSSGIRKLTVVFPLPKIFVRGE